MAISDDIQRYMPSAADRDEPRGTALAYKEAVLLLNPQEPQFKGEVVVNYKLIEEHIHATFLLTLWILFRWMTSTRTHWTTRTTSATDGSATNTLAV